MRRAEWAEWAERGGGRAGGEAKGRGYIVDGGGAGSSACSLEVIAFGGK